ncbi:DUF4279 domain-containing protein [Ornithinibacillus californiensis]|uniref:DUF4279 domain-containing protein n=1 Tax=Ornithinibacillus californiensis TaxID=161536 RepID=UPI0022A974C6|nr:DUF4279 domain-containing protein [Ornithinibacillus californiensis]
MKSTLRTSVEIYFALEGSEDNDYDFELALVTDRLGISPTSTQKMGEFHNPERAKQLAINPRQYSYTQWKYSTGRIETLDFEGLVDEIVNTFKDKVSVIIQLRDEYGIRPYIGMVPKVYNGMSPGYSLTIEQMQFMIDIGVGMDLDEYVYPFTEPEDDDVE